MMSINRDHIGGTISLAVWIMISAILIAGCSEPPSSDSLKRPTITGVTMMTVTPSSVSEIYEATGTIRSERTSMVSSRTMGAVTSLLIREGDIVKAGQLLLTIDNRDAVQRTRAAEMAVETTKQNKSLAETTWQRYKNLYDEKALSQQEMDQVESQKKVAEMEYERTKAMADEAKTYQAFTRVTAPVPGRITQKHIDVGSMASPGMPLLIIEGGGNPYVEVAVDERFGGKIKTGMAVEVTIDALNRFLQGIVREIVPAVDPLSRTFTIKIGLKDAKLGSGLFARVRIPVGMKEAILVPEKAIVRKGQLTGVYAVDSQGVITYRLIRTGASYANGIEVLSGLERRDQDYHGWRRKGCRRGRDCWRKC